MNKEGTSLILKKSMMKLLLLDKVRFHSSAMSVMIILVILALGLTHAQGGSNPFGGGGGAKKNPFGSNFKNSGLGDQCFCKLEGQISDCKCSVETVDYFNNMKIFPRISSILQKLSLIHI